MELLKDIGIAGFLFFLIKGLVWLVVFYLIYKGILNKEQVSSYKTRLYNRLNPFRSNKS